MSELVFTCDIAPVSRRRGQTFLSLACLLWLPVSIYLPAAALGFVAIAVYFDRLRHVADEMLLEVSVCEHQLRIRNFGQDTWEVLPEVPRVWGRWVVAGAPSHLVPFGVLFFSESMLGSSLFRQVRRMVNG